MTGRRESDSIEDQVKYVQSHVKRMSWGARIAAIGVISSLLGTAYGGFIVYKEFQDMVAKVNALEPDHIQAQIDNAMVKLDEGVSYAKDIKNDLRSDVIQVEKALGDVENRIRATEAENRTMVKEAQKWFDDRTAAVDEKLNALEERLNKRLQRALDNPLIKELEQ